MKTLGLLLLASLVLGASAVSAQANPNAKFTAASPGSMIGSGEHEFTAAGGEVDCHATFYGEYTAATQTQTVGAAYEKCTALGFIGATITMNGCDFLYHLNGTTAGGIFYAATVDLVCPAGQEVTIDAGPCALHIPGQTGLGPVVFTNGTWEGFNDITAHAAITGIHGTLTKGNFLCFFTAGTFTNGTYTGTTTFSGRKGEGGAQNIDIG